LYSRDFDPVKHQPSPSKSINITQTITIIDIEGIYGTNILQTRLVEGETIMDSQSEKNVKVIIWVPAAGCLDELFTLGTS
jgi:hypothetical protein